ncbi:hypothetical protein [Polyangium mundeleinium]|uniref:Uncharacterized protein n=1 Tax=Polyangium mundeleinium TaxID=2995306 RepID=A0ABT5ET64_9BACT|nr:hypothetical protein [Polyangium mundeleinium]MDC0745018.1 hypothetical protein [Polyangium mundeleinium]
MRSPLFAFALLLAGCTGSAASPSPPVARTDVPPPPPPAKPVGWSHAYGTNLWPWAVAVGADDRIAVIGWSGGTCDLGRFHLEVPREAGFLAWFDADGAVAGARTFTAAKPIDASIAVDATGSIAIGGSVESPLDLGDGVVAGDARSSSNGWVAKLDSKGRALWARAFASIRHSHRIHDLAMGPDGGVVVAGLLGGVAGQIALGDATLTGSAILSDAFVASLDANGGARFFSLAGTPGTRDIDQHARDVVVARSGEILVHGSHEVITDKGNTLGFDPAAYFQTFDSNGAAHPTRVVRAIDEAAVGHALALDSRGRVITVGAFKGTLDFGMGAMTTRPGRHEYTMFLAALVP